MAVGHAAVEFFVEVIERLRPAEGAGRDATVPYLVLTSFVNGRKRYQAAGDLGISVRQLTRESGRAIRLLMSELENGADTDPTTGPTAGPAGRCGRFLPEPIPSILVFMPRPAQTQALRTALKEHRLVHVHGPPGIGKTALVAELAGKAGEDSAVLWHRFRHGVKDTLASFLFELGQHVHAHDHGELAEYLTEALPTPDLSLATRLALQALAGTPRLIVLDDVHTIVHARDVDNVDNVDGVGGAITGLLEEASGRLPDLRVVTISRHRRSRREAGTRFEVAPLSRLEVRSLLERHGVAVDPRLADSLHRWTGGICQLVKLAASWLKTATPEEVTVHTTAGVDALGDTEGVQAFLLDTITELIGPEDRGILRAASVFRDRFTDDALAFVAHRTRGEIQDASMRLVRSYLATRGRRGDVAFFHTSVRDYVYARVGPRGRAELHTRAALWYERRQNMREAEYHAHAAIDADVELADLGS